MSCPMRYKNGCPPRRVSMPKMQRHSISFRSSEHGREIDTGPWLGSADCCSWGEWVLHLRRSWQLGKKSPQPNCAELVLRWAGVAAREVAKAPSGGQAQPSQCLCAQSPPSQCLLRHTANSAFCTVRPRCGRPTAGQSSTWSCPTARAFCTLSTLITLLAHRLLDHRLEAAYA